MPVALSHEGLDEGRDFAENLESIVGAGAVGLMGVFGDQGVVFSHGRWLGSK